MNNFSKIASLFIIILSVVSCSKSDSKTEPLRDYTAQYQTDKTTIETFLQTHYMTVNTTPGENDQDVDFPLIDNGQTPIWQLPNLTTRTVTVTQNDVDVTYVIYYLKLREGTGQSPCNVDKVLASYKGQYLYSSTDDSGVTSIALTQFENLVNPQSFLTLSQTIRGWSEIFPQFKTGTYSSNGDGTISYDNFGAGVMFIPSGLAYYNSATGSIPAYSPLVFSFKLYEIQRVDNDGDGIPSYQEDLNGDGYVYQFTKDKGIVNPDNTNGPGSKVLLPDGVTYSDEDEVPDFLDTDDDGDHFTTASEIKNPITGDPYTFDNIPLCTDGKKKHLSTACHN